MGRQFPMSSNVSSASYSNSTRQMAVTFDSGRKYLYEGVSLRKYRALTHARSKGKWVWRNLRRKPARFSRVR